VMVPVRRLSARYSDFILLSSVIWLGMGPAAAAAADPHHEDQDNLVIEEKLWQVRSP
jgi:hypothetical protein